MRNLFLIFLAIKVFDIGCGQGVFLYLLAILRKPKRLYGVDILDTNLEVVKSVFPKVKYKKVSNYLDWPRKDLM